MSLQGYPRSSIYVTWKPVRNFLLVINSKTGPILHRLATVHLSWRDGQTDNNHANSSTVTKVRSTKNNYPGGKPSWVTTIQWQNTWCNSPGDGQAELKQKPQHAAVSAGCGYKYHGQAFKVTTTFSDTLRDNASQGMARLSRCGWLVTSVSHSDHRIQLLAWTSALHCYYNIQQHYIDWRKQEGQRGPRSPQTKHKHMLKLHWSCQLDQFILQPFRRSSFLECALKPKIVKINFKNPIFWKFMVFQSHRCW